jgi:5-methylthioadenosine/S-adenosylhomocysteine deaminase
MTILIKNIMVDGKIQDIFLEDGVIHEISDNCIKPADKVINGRNKAALPSFINGHTHAAMSLFRGYADDMPLKQWLEGKIWPLEEKLTEEDVYWGAKLACLEMIKNGITAFNDMYWQWKATAMAVKEMGIRGYISAVFIDMFDSNRSNEQIDLNMRLFEMSKQYQPWVTFTFGPHAIYTVSRESLEWMRDLASREKILIHMHLSETEDEVHFSKEKYGMSPVEFLDSIGILAERFIGCHGCFLDENDCNILKRSSSKLVHMPVSNLKLAVGRIFPYVLVKEYGIPFCFGTDGCASNNNLDLIETMKFAALLAKFSTHNPTMMPAMEAFGHATKTAAAIFGMGEWEIKVGASPDIILIDLARPEMTPDFDICSNLVYASNGSVVDTVICMGKVLMENRTVPGEEDIMRNASKIAQSLVAR